MKNKNDLFNADKALSPNGKEKRSKTKIEDLTIYNVYLFDNETGNVLQKISSEVSEDEAEEIVSCSFDIPGKFFNYYEAGSDFDKRLEKDIEDLNGLKD
jgi:hypothetical protein